MRVDLIHLGYEISLALRNLRHVALQDPDLAASVQVHLHDISLRTFERPTNFANRFTPFSPWERLLGELVEAAPDVVGFSCYLWNVEVSTRFASHVKRLLPRVTIVLGGPEVTHRACEVLARAPHIDAVVCGEGEATFADLLGRLVAGRGWDDVAGLAWRDLDGTPRLNPPRPPLARLDDIPSPYRAELAADSPTLRCWDGYVIYETLRGCPYDCGFCLYGQGSRRVRTYGEERVVDDLLGCLRAGLNVMIVDSSFGLRKKRALRLLDGLIAHQPYAGGISIEAHPGLLDEALIDRLAEARCLQVGLGLQSVGAATNALMGRDFDPALFRSVLERLRERRIVHYVDAIFGMPGDTWAQFLATVDFALSCGDTDVQFHRLLVLPGTRFHAQAAELGLVYADSPPYEVLATPSYPYADLLKSHKLVFLFHLLHAATGGPAVVRRLIAASSRRPSELLQDLAAWLEERGVVLAAAPEAIGELRFALVGLLDDYLRARGLRGALDLAT